MKLAQTLLIAGTFLFGVPGAALGQAGAVDLEATLARVGAQLERRFERVQRILSTETVSVRSFTHGMQAHGPPRRFEFERRVEWGPSTDGGPPAVMVRRRLLAVDGRQPRPRDLEACHLPEGEVEDPLSALMPARHAEFDFSLDGLERIDGRPVVRIAYIPREAGPTEVTWDDECVSIELDNWSRGAAWVDVASGDVLRLDQRLMRRFEFRQPRDGTASHPPRRPGRLVLERDDTSIRYHRVTFEDPDETLMLPRSIEQSWVLTGGGFLPRYYRVQEFSNHRRFVTDGRLVDVPGTDRR